MSQKQDLPVFQLKQVSKKFGNFLALEDINLSIYPGERVALIGSSGAGKSTLLNLLNGSQMPTTGEISILGANPQQLSPRKLRQLQQKIGTIYQELHLVENLRVIHNVNAGHLGRWSFFKALVSLINPLEVDTAMAALTKVGIPEKLYEFTYKLSGGQKQRVALARVLIQNPLVILADEPISSLDSHLSRDIMNLFLNMNIFKGINLVISLHNVEFACTHCHRIIGLRHGKVIFDSPPQHISSSMLQDLYGNQG